MLGDYFETSPCERLRAELRDRRREESRLSSRLDQLESSVFERMQLLQSVLPQTSRADGHDEQQSETQSRRSEAATAKQQSETHSRQSEEGRLAAFQRNVDRLMDGREHQPARSGGEETKGSTPSGTNAKSHFRVDLSHRAVGKTLFPHVTFRHVSLQVNMGKEPLKPLPFKCRMIQSAAKADVEETPDPSLAGKFEVVLPVCIPDEGSLGMHPPGRLNP
eukprot:g17522.t1